MNFKILFFLLFTVCVLLIHSCSSTKYVPQGEYWLENASVKVDAKKISTFDLEPYIQQKPNFKTLAVFRLPLFIYNLSGRDTTKWINRVLKDGGEAPVIYDSTKVDITVDNLAKIMSNKGYVHAQIDPIIKKQNQKVKVTYDIKAGNPYRISEYSINIPDSVFQNKLSLKNLSRQSLPQLNDSIVSRFNINRFLKRNTLVKNDAIFDLDMLNEERERVASAFRRVGYYNFDKEYIGFIADTSSIGNNQIDLELTVYPYFERLQDGGAIERLHKQYIVKDVYLFVDFNPFEDGDVDKFIPTDIVTRDNGRYKIFYGKRGNYIKPFMLMNNCYITPGALYSETATTMTYNAFSQLHILKNINIRYQEIIENDSTKLRCIIIGIPDKKQGVAVEWEGTNSAGQFGLGTSVGYTHRNLFKGSELFNIKAYGGYEALTPSFTAFKENYFEIGAHASISFPRFMFPFLSRDLRRKLQASTQLSADYTYQRRPGFFTRTIQSSTLSYIWNNRRNNSVRHVLDLIDISYVHIPQSKLNENFIAKLTPAAQAFSFTDQFILGSGYSFQTTNYIQTFGQSSRRKPNKLYSLRTRVETAGNLLSLIAAITNAPKDSLGIKTLFDTKYVQYALGDVDYSQAITIDEKNSIAWRIGGGIVYPYGNYKMVPIQKRFFSGGANSVRGWGARELGPGSFYKEKATFYDQSGEIRFDANIEYRSKVFWKLELATFLDAGNIWTIKNYENQEGGRFDFKTLYKEIALSWGLGFRLDFDYILVRLDCGWKVYNPADIPAGYTTLPDGTKVANGRYKSKWAIARPLDFKKNVAWHIAVGYPF